MPGDDLLNARFEIVRRVRPVALVSAEATQLRIPEPASGQVHACPRPAPYAAATVAIDGPATLTWRSGAVSLTARCERRRAWLEVTTPAGRSVHRSRRHGRADGAPTGLALTLTGTHLTVLTREDGPWTGRARVDLDDLDLNNLDTRDEAWLAGLTVSAAGAVRDLRAGAFGQLGLRDIRVVTNADGSPYAPDDRILLTATSAGPGFFDTAHASVWELDPDTLDLHHRADLYFRRSDRPGVYGDHAIHVVREDDGWLVATSTWGDFDKGSRPVGTALARTDADLLAGEHVLDTEPLALPTDGLTSVGTWDPHLVRDTTGGWLVGYVSARAYFEFHPVLATGPSLDALRLRAAATDRIATEGTTLHPTSDGWRVLASDGRDNPPGLREQYPVYDLDLNQLGTLDAAYPTNIPWPTLVERGSETLLIGFNAAAYGGRLMGYGTHGAVVIASSERARTDARSGQRRQSRRGPA